jgi:histidyl-tRNA synthetase
MITAQNLKGFRDFLPVEALKRQWLKNKLIEIFEAWGYDPLETPTLEPLEIFEGQIGSDEKLFYKFQDPGGRNVALRYDQTVPTCRVVGQYANSLVMPFKRYQIQSTFRAENTQKGRYREFTQCDADIFGIKSPLADAETIALSLDIFKSLDFKSAKVLISDRNLLKDIPYEALVVIDKIKRIGRDEVIKQVGEKYLSYVENLKPNETIQVILDYLKNCGFEESWYAFEPTIARSFAYSSGPIWEVEIPGFDGGSVLGGERYDNIVKNISGLDIPGTGFGLGFDRTLEAAEQFGLVPTVSTITKVLVTVFSPELLNNSIKIASFLREKIPTELYPDADARLDKQLKYADRKNIPFVVIIGPDEAAKNTVQLKNLATKEQKEIKEEEISKYVCP